MLLTNINDLMQVIKEGKAQEWSGKVVRIMGIPKGIMRKKVGGGDTNITFTIFDEVSSKEFGFVNVYCDPYLDGFASILKTCSEKNSLIELECLVQFGSVEQTKPTVHLLARRIAVGNYDLDLEQK